MTTIVELSDTFGDVTKVAPSSSARRRGTASATAATSTLEAWPTLTPGEPCQRRSASNSVAYDTTCRSRATADLSRKRWVDEIAAGHPPPASPSGRIRSSVVLKTRLITPSIKTWGPMGL